MYALGALALKRSSELGVGLWRTTFVANMVVASVFSILWGFGGAPVQTDLLWQPALIAMCLFGGQLSQFLALEKGDVSIAVPVFGLKVILVALLSPVLTGDTVDARLWVAACLSVLGVTFLNRRDGAGGRRGIGITLAAGGFGAVCFAVFDVLVQKWGPAWGAGRLLPCVFWINALLSLTLVARFSAPLRAIRPQAWPWLGAGSLLLALQSVTFVSTLAVYGQAASANVVYASRGLLSVALVWLVGHWFRNTEQNLGVAVLRWRLIGALTMMSAIVIVVLR
jgi:drug/metabolite transporter (DMT)-like permease